MLRNLETLYIFAFEEKHCLMMRRFKTLFLENAIEFLEGISEQAREKVLYNIRKVEGGVISNDLFKKTGGDRNLGIQNPLSRHPIPFVCILGYQRRYLGRCNSRNRQEGMESPYKGNSKSGRDKKAVFQF